MRFHDRTHAAYLLAEELKRYHHSDTVVVAIPRGGVPMGYVLAHQLGLPLDVIMVKKISHPDHPEFAIGSVSATDYHLTAAPGISQNYINSEIKRLRDVMKDRLKLFIQGRESVPVKGKSIILVDDGLATGNTMLMSIRHLRKLNPAKIIVAVPVASNAAFDLIHEEADELICLYTAPEFYAVGQFYDNFQEVTDEQVVLWLEKAYHNVKSIYKNV